MGASSFNEEWQGKTPQAAFRGAVESAQWEFGHGGYSGSMAEKSDFEVVHPVGGETPEGCINRHIDADTFGDKWGPAGCVHLGSGKYRFFGWASE